jgi:hypothetical protein
LRYKLKQIDINLQLGLPVFYPAFPGSGVLIHKGKSMLSHFWGRRVSIGSVNNHYPARSVVLVGKCIITAISSNDILDHIGSHTVQISVFRVPVGGGKQKCVAELLHIVCMVIELKDTSFTTINYKFG